MKQSVCTLMATAVLIGWVALRARAVGQAAVSSAGAVVTELPAGYRDWPVISVAP